MPAQEKKVLIPVEFRLAEVMQILQNPPEGLRMYPITKRPENGTFIDSLKIFPYDKVRFDLTIGSGVANVDIISLKSAMLKSCCGPVYHGNKPWYVFVLWHDCGQAAKSRQDDKWWGKLQWGQNLMAGEICAEGQPQGRLFDLLEGLNVLGAGEPRDTATEKWFRAECDRIIYGKEKDSRADYFSLFSRGFWQCYGKKINMVIRIQKDPEIWARVCDFSCTIISAVNSFANEERFVFAGTAKSVSARNFWGEAKFPVQIVGNCDPRTGYGELFRVPDEQECQHKDGWEINQSSKPWTKTCRSCGQVRKVTSDTHSI